MTVERALRCGIKALKVSHVETPAVEAGVILCHILGCDDVYLYTHGGDEVLPEDFKKYEEALKLRNMGMPVQYITGRREFMSLVFHVAPGVLVPRHETEVLVEEILSFVKTQEMEGLSPRILDLGTGSGCIAVSLARFIPNSRVTAVDISGEALSIARENAVQNGVFERVEFLQSDLFQSVKASKYDIIASNPPYIPSGDISLLPVDVREYEPRIALEGGEDGLQFYRRIIREAPDYLEKRGLIIFEVGRSQALEVADLLRPDFHEIRIVKDLAGIDRVVCARLN